ncbi:MAG: hypothetical protein R2939_19230 [Kofleriaceae bacterium]
MRLGEILVAEGLVLDGDVARALAAQARHRRRLGAILIGAGLVTADAVARALSRQLGVPAALEKHLAARDPSLPPRLSATTAHRYGAVPIARSRDGALVVCLRDPRAAQALAALERELDARVVPAAASEALLTPLLEQLYGAPDDDFDVDVDLGDGDPAPAAPPDELGGFGLGGFTLARLDDDGVSKDLSQSSPVIALPRTETGSLPPRRDSGVLPAARLGTDAGAPAPAAARSEPPLAAARTLSDAGLANTSSASLAAAARAAVEAARPPPRSATPRAPAAANPAAVAGDLQRMATAATMAMAPTPPSPASIVPAAAQQAVATSTRASGQIAALTPGAVPPLPRVTARAPSVRPSTAELDDGWSDATASAAAATVATPVLDRAAVLVALASAASRDEVAELVVAFARGHLRTALVLIVRDGMALGHRGAGPELTPAAIEAIAVPLHQPSTLKLVVDGRQPFVGTVPDGNAMLDRFLKVFGTREVVMQPVVLGSRVACVIVGGGTDGALADLAGDLRTVAEAMAAAFLRIIRDGKQPGAKA